MHHPNWQKIQQAKLNINNKEVHVWRTNLYAIKITTDILNTLNQAEQERANNFKFEIHKNRFILTRYYLRLLLGHYLTLDPNTIEFSLNKYGKPFIANQHLTFNLSHADDWVIYAISKDNPIGVDIESNRKVDYLGLAKRFFSNAEYQSLSKLTEAKLENAFFHIWTQKEAITKAIGQGICYGLDNFTVSSSPPAKILDAEKKLYKYGNWQLTSFVVDKNYCAALATISNQRAIEFYYL